VIIEGSLLALGSLRARKARAATQTGTWVAWLGCVLFLCGCAAKHYRQSADKDSYAAIAQKAPLVTNMEPRFTIEQTNGSGRAAEGGRDE
jgi:hypothetical protein